MINRGPPPPSQESPGAGGEVKGLLGKKRNSVANWLTGLLIQWRHFSNVTSVEFSNLMFVLNHQKCEENAMILSDTTVRSASRLLLIQQSDNTFVYLRMWIPVTGGSTSGWRCRDLEEMSAVAFIPPSLPTSPQDIQFCSMSSVTSFDPVNCLLGTPL